MSAPITLFLVDDHDVVRRGLRAYAEVQPGLEVVGEAASGEQALASIDALAAAGAEPTVVLMDLVLPGMDGVATTAALLRSHPRIRVLVLTSFGGQQRVQTAMAAGAAGYLLKSADVDDVADAIQAVTRGVLKGQKIMAIPGSSQLAACEQMVEAEQSLGNAVGTPVTIYQNDGLTSQWDSGIETAISGGYKAVILTCSINPLSIVPAIEQAADHGVKVVDYAVNYPVTRTSYPGLASGVGESVVQDAKLSVEQAFVHSRGKPFSMLLITSNAVEGEPLDVAEVKSEMRTLCGNACQIYSVDIEVPDWATKIQSTVQSNLLVHPAISVVYPLFSGEYLFALPAIEAAHRSNVVLVGGFGNGTPEIQLQLSPPGNTIAIGQISSYADWAAYEAYYQTALVLAGQTPRPYADTFTPNVLTTPANAKAVLSGVDAYGDSFVNGYRKLFGLPALSGSALLAAATVGHNAE